MKKLLTLLVLFLSLIFFSCDYSMLKDDEAPSDGKDSSADTGSSSYESGDEALPDYGGSGSSDSYDTGTTGDDGGSDAGEKGSITQQPGQITAAQWRDLDNWDFWLELLENQTYDQYVRNWGYYHFERINVTVTDGESPAVDAVVKLIDKDYETVWIARTDNKGEADLFVYPFFKQKYEGDLSVEVVYEKEKIIIEEVVSGEKYFAEYDLDKHAPDVLDLMFMIDTTGSMGDELEYLKAELYDVIQEVHKNYGSNLKVRLSCNFYRDEGDEYVVRSFPFTTDVEEVLNNLKKQSAAGGGDRPEAVDKALEDGVNNHDWSKSAKARLMFLVLDAPPHLNKQGVPESIRKSVKDAAEKGIRIIPVAASGVDKSDEFFLRSIDIYTGATYIFVTDHSGIGDSHIEPTVGQYEVKLLNNLLVEIISDYL